MGVRPSAVSVVIPHYGDPEPTSAVVAAVRTQVTDVEAGVVGHEDDVVGH